MHLEYVSIARPYLGGLVQGVDVHNLITSVEEAINNVIEVPDFPHLGKITGLTYGAHAILLLTKTAKMEWIRITSLASKGECNGYTDLAYSLLAPELKQYFLKTPIYRQPDHAVTNTPWN